MLTRTNFSHAESSSKKRRQFRGLALEALEIRITPTTLPAGFVETSVTVPKSVVGATAMEFSPTGELFVLEKKGAAKLVQNGGTTSTAATMTVDSNSEHGLLGMTFDPTYDGTGPNTDYVYLYYTTPRADAVTPAHNRISRFEVSGAGTQTPTFINEKIIREIPPEDEDNDPTTDGDGNHNGGSLHIYNNKLYVSVGDHKYNTVTQGQHVSQLLTTPFGKMLRLNLDGTDPTDNPFFNANTPNDWAGAIWTLGLRNPFKFDINQTTGQIFINDVGENDWEEIDLGEAGANYGWSGPIAPVWEGFESPPPPWAKYRDPLMAYDHSGATLPTPAAVSITGGAFYPGNSQFGSLYAGHYFFIDYRGGFIRDFDPAHPGTVANPDTSTDFASSLTAGYDVDLKVDAAGNLYYLSSGAIYKISFVNTSPSINGNGSVTVNENTTAVTMVAGQDAETPTALTYQILAGLGNGADGAKFNIDAKSGALAFISPPNFESPQDANADNTYNVTVQVTDPSGATATQTLAVKIADVNEKPVFTTAANTNISENIASPLTFAASDVDRPTQSLTFNLAPTSLDANDFVLNSSTGVLTFVRAGGADYESPTDANLDNIYSIDVQVSDNQGGSTTQTFTITVTDVSIATTTVSINVAGNIEVKDAAAKNDDLTLARSGTSLIITDGSTTADGIVSVAGVAGAVLNANKKSVLIPLAAIVATGKPLIFNTGGGNDLITIDANNSFNSSLIPSTGLTIGLGAGNDKIDLVNDPTNNTWTFTGKQSGNLMLGQLGTATFSGLEYAVGGSGKDIFKLANPTTANGILSLDGDTGSNLDSVMVARNANMTLTNAQLTIQAQTAGQVDQTFGLANIKTATLTGGNSDNFLNATLFSGPVTLNGSEGNDVLWGGSGNDMLNGGNGHDWLSGNDGDDVLIGSNGRDILVGGKGADTINSQSLAVSDYGEDILIAGRTNFDANKAAVDALMLAWLGSDSFANRIQKLKTTGTPTGAYKLNNTTVFDDNAIDTLFGGQNNDWFFVKTSGATKDTHDATGTELAQVIGL